MADDKTTKTPEQPVTDSGPGKETPPAPPKEPEKVSVSPEPEKKTEPEVKNPQVSVYNFAEIMKEKKVEERAAAPSGEKPAPAKTEKPEKQPEAPKKAEEKPKEPEQPKRRGRPPKADKDKDPAPKSKAPTQKPEKAVKKEPEKKTAPTVQTAPAPKEPEKPKDAPRRGKEQIVYIKLNELHAFKNHPFEVRDDEEMRAMVSSVKDKGVTQPATPVLRDIHAVEQQIKDKSAERKNMLAEKKACGILHPIRLHQLSGQIAALTEEIEELRDKKSMLLASLNCHSDSEAHNIKKRLEIVEQNLTKLTEQHEKLTAMRDESVAEFEAAHAEICPEDIDSVKNIRIDIRREHTRTLSAKLRETFGSDYDYRAMMSAERKADTVIGETTDSISDKAMRREYERRYPQRKSNRQKQKHNHDFDTSR